MAEVKRLGVVKCPLWYCGEHGAEIREGEKGSAYLVCGECGSLLRSPIGKAQRAMRALVVGAPKPEEKKEEKKDDKKPEDKKAEPPKPEPAAKPADKGRRAGFF